MNSSKQVSRAMHAIEAARASAKDNHTSCILEDIHLYTEGYAEPGYEGKVVAIGNWNNVDEYDCVAKERKVVSTLPRRLARVLEKLHIECEWGDEWVACNDCGKLLRTQPDSMWWKPSFYCDENGAHCRIAHNMFGFVGCNHT